MQNQGMLINQEKYVSKREYYHTCGQKAQIIRHRSEKLQWPWLCVMQLTS